MSREILTYPLDLEQIRVEFNHFINYLISKGFRTCEVLFGSAWGNEYYPTNEWNDIVLDLSALAEEVARVESLGYGTLGYDDLFISVHGLPLKFHFCNDADIHISLEDTHEVAEAFYQRWKELGYKPAEWVKAAKGPSTERIRFE